MYDFIHYKIGKFLSLILPLKVGYIIAIILSDLHFLTSQKDRDIILNNLRTIFPLKSEKEIKKIAIKVFRNFGKYLVDFFRFSKIDKEYIKRYVKVEGREYIDKVLKEGKGVVTLTAHIGNWELAGAVMAVLGYPICAIALPHKDKRVDNFFNRQRQMKGVKVIPLGRAVRSCIESLKNNKIISILGDRDFTQGGMILDFFNHSSSIPKGPAAFSLITGAPIIPGFMIREKDDKFRLILEEPISFSPSGDREKDIQELTKKCIRRIEEYVKKYPDQWCCFGKFWIG